MFNLRDQVGGCEGFDLHKQHWLKRSAKSEIESVVEHPDPGAEADPGM